MSDAEAKKGFIHLESPWSCRRFPVDGIIYILNGYDWVGLGFRSSDHFVRDSLVLIGQFIPFGCEASANLHWITINVYIIGRKLKPTNHHFYKWKSCADNTLVG